jgi:4-hydroxybenzoate polyprenyltransferase
MRKDNRPGARLLLIRRAGACVEFTGMIAVAAPAPGTLRVFASVTRLHIVAIAAVGTLTFGWIFTGSYLWLLSMVCALDWFLVNLLNRVVDLPEDRANGIVGTDFVARHASTVRSAALAVLVGSVVLVHLVLPAITLIRVAFHSLGLVYNWPVLPGGARIKQLYFWKNTAPATGFLQTCVAYPLAAAHGELAEGVRMSTVLVTSAFFFLFELSYELIYDLRDAPGDREAGVRSYAVVHGEVGAARILHGLCVASLAVLVFGFASRAVPWRIAVLGVGPIVQVVLCMRWLRRGLTSADCVSLTWLGTGLLVAYHLWVVAGLPGVTR